MNLVDMGSTGVKVSEFCLGTLSFADRCDYQESELIINRALDLGINYIDTAPMYSDGKSEEYIGKIIQDKRENFFIETKVHKGIDRKSILESIVVSLSRLKTDYVDLYLIHWPVVGMDVNEVMSALNEVVKSGKSRFVGCSNYPAWLFAHSNMIAEKNNWPKLICNSVAYNLFERGVEIEILPQAVAEKIVINPYRVLATGLLTRRYDSTIVRATNSRVFKDSRVITWYSQYKDNLERFYRFAQDHQIDPATLAISWVRHNKAVTCPILGVSSIQQLDDLIHGFDFDLSSDEYDQVTSLMNTEIREEGLQEFQEYKYNFPRLRRNLDLLDGKRNTGN